MVKILGSKRRCGEAERARTVKILGSKRRCGGAKRA